MKKSDLKKALKPIIKECIKEAIFEEGVLSNIIAEVVQGLGAQTIVETKTPPVVAEQRNHAEEARQAQLAKIKREETRQKMLQAVGTKSYNGVDLFEGTTPASTPVESKQGDPLNGVAPSDPGVDISQLFGGSNKSWNPVAK